MACRRHPAAAQGRLQALESQLAALSAPQRNEPARLPSGPRIVSANPALFDGRRPRSDIRLLVIGPTRYFPALYETVERQIDRAALRSMIDA
jgi:hypothetical protein